MFKRLSALILSVVILFTVTACNNTDTESGGSDLSAVSSDVLADNVVSRVVQNEDGNNYIEYNGEPYLFYGTQIRIDNIRERMDTEISIIDEVFGQAKKDGFNTVVVPVKWYQIEPNKDQFDFSIMELYYQAIYKYDLTVQWLWFGTNVCGSGGCTPEYMRKSNEYPKIKPPEGQSGIYYDFSSNVTLEREKYAVGKFMEFIAERDTERRCVMIQVNNEVSHGGPVFENGDVLWYTSEEYNFKYAWSGGQHYAVAKYLNELGDVIHASDYNCVTRVNIMQDAWTVGRDITDVLVGGTGIDIIGIDCYDEDWSTISVHIHENEGNVFHFAESSVGYDHGRTTAKFFAEGLGYLEYAFHNYSAETLISTYYNINVKEKDFFVPLNEDVLNATRGFNGMVNKVQRELAYAVAQGCVAAFNYEHYLEDIETKRTFGELEVTFTCPTDGYGLAFWLSEKEFIVMASNDDTAFKFGATKVTEATTGSFKDGEWVADGEPTIKGNQVILDKYQVVKVTLK